MAGEAGPGDASRARTLFVAGSTGATGRTLLGLAPRWPVTLVPHVRPGKARESLDSRAAVLDLDDAPALVAALRGCTTVLQLIGTMRKRFATGDTYESSDVGTTRKLALASREAGVDHLVLLSSIGAGHPVGPYLAAKARAESIVRESGVPWTILRPSAFEGEGHRVPPGMKLLTRLPGLSRFRPIALEDLGSALLEVAATRARSGRCSKERASTPSSPGAARGSRSAREPGARGGQRVPPPGSSTLSHWHRSFASSTPTLPSWKTSSAGRPTGPASHHERKTCPVFRSR